MAELIPLRDAVESINARTPIGSLLRSAEWARVPVALRQRAQFSAGVESARVLDTIQDRLSKQIALQREQLATGKTATFDRSSFIDELRRIGREEGLTPQDPSKVGGIQDITSIPRLGLIYDMQNNLAQGHARWKLDQTEGALLLYPAQEFMRVEDRDDPRTDWPERFIKAATAAGDSEAVALFQRTGRMVALKTSALWSRLSRFDVPWPPFDFQSGMGLEDVDRDEAVALGLMDANQRLKPAEEDFNKELQASVRGMDGKLVQFLKESFGDQVKVQDGAMWWTGDRRGKALAVPKAQPEPPPPEPDPIPAAPATAVATFPENLDGLRTIKSLGGSTGALLVEDRAGRRYVLKRGNSAAHVREEFAADQIYRAAGAAVPEARLYDGDKPAKLAQYVEGRTLAEYLQSATEEQRAATLRQLREHFAVDALLGNWDVAGLGMDNILVDATGKPWRIDNGGSLRYRAQGTAKKATEWDDYATELWSLRDAETNGQTASVFGELSIYDIARQIEKLDEAKILDAAPEAVRATLSQRLANLRDIGRKATEYERTTFKAGYADGVTREIMHLRKGGVSARLPSALNQSAPGDVRPKDSAGRPFDHLRSTAGAAPPDVSQAFLDAILPAAKTINGHHAAGNTTYNASKIQAAAAKKTELMNLAFAGTPQQKAMASHYLAVLNQIETAQGDTSKKVEKVEKFPMPVASNADAPSTTVALADFMRERGGDWDVIREWASAQGGSSTSPKSMALKYWLMNQLEGAKPSDFHNPPKATQFNAEVGKNGAKYEKSFHIFHAAVQELLGRVEFEGNDQANRMVRVIRTETTGGAVPFKKGATGEYKRGINESGSIFRPTFSGTRTITAVPHTRLTGIYFFEQNPGKGNTFFLGDDENEVTYIAHGLKAFNVGTGSVKLDPGKNKANWEL